MKNFKFALWTIMALLTCCGIAACSDEDKDEPTLTDIVGTWKLSQVSTDGENYIPWPYTKTTATIKADGTYSGQGYFGIGSGSWKQSGKTIITYVDGEEYMRYEVRALSSSACTLVMKQGGSSLWAKCVKI